MSKNGSTTVIAIRIDGREPMRGTVQAGSGNAPQLFVGWLGLLKALEGSLAMEPEKPST